MSVNGGGEDQPPVRNYIGDFFLKEKMMHNVLKRKNMYLEVIFPSKSYVLNHSESIDMHFEKRFCRTGGRGGGQKVIDMSATISFFTPSLNDNLDF